MSILSLRNGQYLDTESGVVVSGADAIARVKKAALAKKNVNVKQVINKVIGVDDIRIDLSLKTKNGNIAVSQGFLVELYLSGSDGKLTRLYNDSIVDPIGTDSIRASLSDYIDIEVDI